MSLLLSGWNYEGTLGFSYQSSPAAIQDGNQFETAVERLYNPNSGLHYYTASEYEARSLIAAGWNDEGAEFINSGTTMIYAAYNPNSGQHNFTSSIYEENALVSAGWVGSSVNAFAFELAAPGVSNRGLLWQYNL